MELVCLQVAQFFSTGLAQLVGSADDIVLDCYRLAKHYSQPPDVFLNMSLTDIRLHMWRTSQLARIQAREASSGN